MNSEPFWSRPFEAWSGNVIGCCGVSFAVLDDWVNVKTWSSNVLPPLT